MYLEHVNITVSDLGRSIEFFCRLFDFHIRWQGSIQGNVPAAHVGDDRFYIAMFQATQEEARSMDMARVGINHAGFVVDDLTVMRQRLKELGVELSGEADYETSRSLYFLDPDGITVELVEYA